MSKIKAEDIVQAMSYEAYMALTEELVAEGKTTGPKQSESLVYYTGLNLRRMKRLNKTARLEESTQKVIESIQEPQIWVVLTEAWCGDAAQILPILHTLTALNPHIELKLLLRDEHPSIMDAYLSNGSRSIPKLIMLRKADLEELGIWGPRPAEAHELLIAHKAQPGRPYDELTKDLQIWYNQDKGRRTQAEITHSLQQSDHTPPAHDHRLR